MFRPLSRFTRNQTPATSGEYSGSYSADPFHRLHNEMNRLFDDAFSGFGLPLRSEGPSGFRSPQIDVRETDAGIELEAELPGVDENDVNVEIMDNLLTIRGEKKFERRDDKEGDYRVMERSYGSFSRSLTLPFAVNPDDVKATFRNGVLKLVLPKPPEAQAQTRRIAINRDEKTTKH